MANITTNSPGVYRGKDKLATESQLIQVEDYLTGFIVGNGNTPGNYGYVPYIHNSDGSNDYNSMFSGLLQSLNAGITVHEDGIKVGDVTKRLNFIGDYVTVSSVIDSDIITIDISKPEDICTTDISNGIFNIENTIVTGIIPDYSQYANSSIYNEIQAGTIINCFNNKDCTTTCQEEGEGYALNEIDIKTSEKIFVNSSFERIKVIVNTYLNTSSFELAVSGNYSNTDISSGYSIYITDFEEALNGHKFNAEVKVNLTKFIEKGIFNIAIQFISNDGSIMTEYSTGNILYNDILTKIPTINSFEVTSPIYSGQEFKYSSGNKYFKGNDTIYIQIDVKNLNSFAKSNDQFNYSFDVDWLNEINEETTSIVFDNTHDLTTFIISGKIKTGIVVSSPIKMTITLMNAGWKQIVEKEIKVLINSVDSNNSYLYEDFLNENYRRTGSSQPFDKYTSNNSIANGESYQKQLFVIPGKGLGYPYGDWHEYLPSGINYDNIGTTERYYLREFKGNDLRKFGGIFVFEGVMKCELTEAAKIEIICGTDVYDLMTVRNMLNSDNNLGIQTEIITENGITYIHWAYPKNVSSTGSIYLRIKLSSQINNKFIKSIKLLNIDGEENW